MRGVASLPADRQVFDRQRLSAQTLFSQARGGTAGPLHLFHRCVAWLSRQRGGSAERASQLSGKSPIILFHTMDYEFSSSSYNFLYQSPKRICKNSRIKNSRSAHSPA